MNDPKHGGHQLAPLTHAPEPAKLALALAQSGYSGFPCNGKEALVKWKPYQNTAPSSVEAQNWWQQHSQANLAIPTGSLNGITVIDVDACGHAPETLPRLFELFGPTPLVVQTSGKGGGYHLYFKHSGERCHRWQLEGLSGDVRGDGGYVMAAGSLHPVTQIHYRTGGDVDWFLSVLRDLPIPKQIPPQQASQEGQLPTEGNRNLWLFKQAREEAVKVESREDLQVVVQSLNTSLATPLPESEVRRIANNVWGYKIKGKLIVGGEHYAKLTKIEWQRLGPDEFYLLAMLRLSHSLRQGFSIGQDTVSKHILGWSKRRLKNAIRGLLASGAIICVHKGGSTKGDAAIYRWGSIQLPI